MNFYLKDYDSYNSTSVCTCGTVTTGYSHSCPKCHATHMTKERKYPRYVRYYSAEHEFDEGAYKETFSLVVLDVSREKLNKSRTIEILHKNEYFVDIDCAKRSVIIKHNGEIVPNEADIINKIMTYFRYGAYGFLSKIAEIRSSKTYLADALWFFIKNPNIEVLYSTYKDFNMLRNIATPCNGTKPHEIIGLSKGAFKHYLNYQPLTRYTYNKFADLNIHIDALRKLDDFYKGKPDKFKKVFDFANAIGISAFTQISKIIIDFNYDIDRLQEYLTNDIYTYQGIASAKEGFGILYDYVSVCERMNAPIDKYPKSLKLIHDIAVKNMKIIVSDIEAAEFITTVSEANYLNLKYKDKDSDYIVIIPEKVTDVIDEGRKLHHCVGSYVDRIRTRQTQICFMRHKDNPDIPLITLEIQNGRLNQYKGTCNRSPNKKEMDFIKHYIKQKGFYL